MATEKRLIRADVTVEAFTKWLTSRYDGRMPADIVDEIPTVDAVEVVHGEWIDAKFVRAVKGTNLPVVRCSKCECYFCDVINNHHYMYHYCPNCGAKMDGDGNG